MEMKQFEEIYAELVKKEITLLRYKGMEYSENINTLKQFEDIAINLDIHPIKVLIIFYSKHDDSIFNYAKNFITYSEEDITGRIMDARNYLAILYAMIIKYRKLDKNHEWYIQ